MDKPIIFFSHSSADKEVLIKLKGLFLEKTGNTIDVFLSSDGQSIPLGKNWIHKIQEALNKTRIMIVFVTPNSIRSNWLYFESGYSFSKDIRVIPVGFLGIDLNTVSPPLSILQGFNIKSEEGLNNLIAITNEEFSYKHDLSFTNEEYTSMITNSGYVENVSDGEYNQFIANITFTLDDNVHFDCKRDVFFDKLTTYVEKEKSEFQIDNNRIIIHGVTIYKSSGRLPEAIFFNLDSLLAISNFEFISNLLSNSRIEGFEGISIMFTFSNWVNLIGNNEKITSRILKTEIKINSQRGFDFRYLNFEIINYADGGTVWVKVVVKNKIAKFKDFTDLFLILFNRGIFIINQY